MTAWFTFFGVASFPPRLRHKRELVAGVLVGEHGADPRVVDVAGPHAAGALLAVLDTTGVEGVEGAARVVAEAGPHAAGVLLAVLDLVTDFRNQFLQLLYLPDR